MDKITVTAKTYDEAITKALIGLQTTTDHMVVDIIEKGSSGFFGVIGARPWTIQARVKTEEEEAAEQKAAAEKAAAEKKAAQEKAAAEKKAAQEKAAAEKKAAQEKAAAEKKAAQEKTPAEKKTQGKNAPDKKKASSEKPAKKASAEKPEGDAENAKREGKPEGRRQRDRRRGGKDGESRNSRVRQDRANAAAVPGKRREEHVGREVLQPEADEIKAKAAEFLTQIFKVMEEEITIDTDFNYQDNELNVMMSGEDMGVLIGKRGQTLDSLQYLVSLVVNKHRDVYIRVKLDTENYRERREQKLKSLARNIAQKVKRTRRPMSLEPMNPYERRIIHSALQRDPYVTTYSEGEDPYRHIIVVLKKDMKRQNRRVRPEADGAAEFDEAVYAEESVTVTDTSEIIEEMIEEASYQDDLPDAPETSADNAGNAGTSDAETADAEEKE